MNTMDENEKPVAAPELADHSEWGLDDTPDNAPDAPKPAETERFRLKHLGEEFEVTREEAIALAQKGRDYDRIRERLLNLESIGGANPGVMREIHDFIAEYGTAVKPSKIPEAVWNDVRAGRPLVQAYQRYENSILRDRIRNEANRARAFGGKGEPELGSGYGEIENDWYM